MKKMIKHYCGRASLKVRTLKNSRAWTPDEEGEWCWLKKGRVTRWGKRINSRPAFHYLVEDDEGEQAFGGLNHLVSRNSGGTQ